MNIFIDLFLAFAKIGLFTFGGGYASNYDVFCRDSEKNVIIEIIEGLSFEREQQ